VYSSPINKLWKVGDGLLSVWGILGAAFILWLIAVVFILGFNHACKINNEKYDEGYDEYIKEKIENNEEKVS
jgi:hypothetical protein